MIEADFTSSANSSVRWAIPAALAAGMYFVVADTSISSASEWRSNVTKQVKSGSADWSQARSSNNQDAKSFLAGWTNNPSVSDWYFELAERLNDLSSKEDGWKGPDSLAASSSGREYALKMLSKLAQNGIDRRPSIGLDYEGTFSFSWLDNDVSADLTIYDDGSYSFFASRRDMKASVDEAKLSDPLNSRLLSILLS